MSERQEVVERNLWAAPALFVFVAWVLFKMDDSPSMGRTAWIVYAASWIPVVGMLGRTAVQRRNPGIGAVFGVGILLIMGAVFWANHG
ncbi:hypothetical protein P6B95_17470 [Streptomyces atratus]|uniref:hypothetical protein n=1 Tax=Streptomyces atratus TaxID=1893 RepID=UPI002AC32A2E|nr:hypothetical protein [Streptomyces atratus]WPW28998.1 hypothetical protein P6B95_17470 [Streptomyces atratus]